MTAQHKPKPAPQDRIPAVAVVIPARNAAGTLALTLASLAQQALQDWEAVVVDDGSSDGTAAIAAAHARRDPRIRCIPGPQRGVSAARNAGIAATRAPLIAFLDADDLWEPAKLRVHADAMAAGPRIGLAFDRILFVDVQGRSTGVTSSRRVKGLATRDFLHENPACTASTLVARREALAACGLFDEELRQSEDLELMLRMRCTTQWAVEGIDRVLTRYRASPSGASAGLEAMQAGWERVMDKVRTFAPDAIDRHLRGARAVHLRYLARRALRLGLPASVGLRLFARAVASSPPALMRQPHRTFGTLAGLLASAAIGPLAFTRNF